MTPPVAETSDVIIPPKKIRELIVKTAARVRKTPGLESKISEKLGSEPRFAFLKNADPYHAYYRHLVDNGVHGDGSGASVATETPVAPRPSRPGDQVRGLSGVGSSAVAGVAVSHPKGEADDKGARENGVTIGSHARQEAAATVSKLKTLRLHADRDRTRATKPPLPDMYTVADLSAVTSDLSLEVIKLVSQFSALYGPEFLTLLSAKEGRNALFDFLRLTHPQNMVMEGFRGVYGEILKNWTTPEETMSHWATEGVSSASNLEKMWHRVDAKNGSGDKSADEPEMEPSLAASNVIDWHDFVVVETVDIDESEIALPAPLSDPAHIPRAMAAADAARRELANNRKDVDMEMEMDMDGDEGDRSMANGSGAVEAVDVDTDIPVHRVRRPEAEKLGRTGNSSEPNWLQGDGARSRGVHSGEVHEQDVRLPDGRVVPLSEATPAMRVQLTDPKYKEERIRAAEKNQRQNLADGEEMALHLARLNRDKPDSGVYNRGDLQEGLSGRSVARPSAISLSQPAIAGPQLPVRGENALPSKRARIEAAVGALTVAATPKAEGNDSSRIPAAGPVPPVAPSVEGKEKLPATGLISEEAWIAKVGEKVEIRLQVPVHSNPDWKLEGQTINMEVPLKKTVVQLKEALSKVTKVPANKQKLHVAAAGFLSNKNTLAHYNISAQCEISLEVKERGGKRKATT